MSDRIMFDYSKSLSFFSEQEINALEPFILEAHNMLHEGRCPGSDYTGWVGLPRNFDRDEFERIKTAAQRIRETSDVLIVIGIGGSYLGARAAVEMLSGPFYNHMQHSKKCSTGVLYAGYNMSGAYLAGLLEYIEGKDISINVISKSGTTTEPAVAFRVLKDYIENKYGGDEAKRRIYVTTDRHKGNLKKLADSEGYETFTIPDDIGGRFSVLTAVGLLPICAAGLNIDNMMNGAYDAYDRCSSTNIMENPGYLYACIRNILYKKGKTCEIMVNYEPQLHYFSEWWKQLFGESEGKDKKGIFPASVGFTSDLHSMGQYIQDGLRNIFETVINVEKPWNDMKIPEAAHNMDGLDFLSGKSFDYINKKAFLGTVLAHVDGGVPNIIINVPEISEYYFGYLVYLFEKACGISGCILGVNPFDQPGVEAYKNNMYALLGKNGYEMEREELEKRLK